MSDKPIEQIRWDLSSLYNSIEDPKIEADLAEALCSAESFRTSYHGQVDHHRLTTELLVAILGEYEALQLKVIKPYLYAQLLFTANSGDEGHVRLVAKVRDVWQQVSEATLFFELELLKIDEEAFSELLSENKLDPFRHYLGTVRAHKPYTLSEPVEQVMKRKDLSGREAFVQLFDELTSGLRFSFHFPGEEAEREATGEELLSLLYHPDRTVREAAFTAFLDKHGEQAMVLTSCFNNILLDHGKESDLRGYPDLMTPTHLSSETDAEMVEQMMTVTEDHYALAQEYFDLKRQLLGLDTLKNTDLYAPVSTVNRSYGYTEACDLVLDAFSGFDPQLSEIAERLMKTGRVDVAPRSGKTGGAFCMGLYPGADPYLLLNFTGNLRDVTTLAHELGHAVHYVLAGDQSFFHYHPPLPLAETASVFGEMLVTRHLLDHEPDPQVRISLLCAKLEEILATTFRQTVLTRFEQKAHEKRGDGLLSSQDLCDVWLEENRKLFGDVVEMIPAYRWGWSYISHFIHARFYCYSYVFGELLVLALYQKYRSEGRSFVPAYLDLLRSGGSVRPSDLVKPLGINLADPAFWAQGYGLVREMLGELKGLIGQK